MIFSYNCRNMYSLFKDEDPKAQAVQHPDKNNATPFSFGQVFPNISDHIILEDFAAGDISEFVSPITNHVVHDPTANPHVTQGIFGTLLNSTSDVEVTPELLGGSSVHESLVLPRFQRAATNFQKLGSFLGPKCDNLKPSGNELSTNSANAATKTRPSSLAVANNENRTTFKSIGDQSLRTRPCPPEVNSRSSLSPSSPKNPAENQVVCSNTAQLPPTAPTPPTYRGAGLSSSTPLPEPLPDTSLISSSLRNFLVRFFADTPFSAVHCTFTPSESLILSSIFSRKYECEVPKQLPNQTL
jgi:hypothetical protein